jgi:methyl-accepting chemotaxis protein
MKINTQSIAFRLVWAGILGILLPLLVLVFFAFSKASGSLTNIRSDRVQGVAADLAQFTKSLLDLEIHQAETIAAQKTIVALAKSVQHEGVGGSQDLIQEVFQDLKGQFPNLHPHYQGLFITNVDGMIYTGVMEGGGEYKAIDLGNRESFKKVKTTMQPIIDEIIISQATGKPVSGALVPIKSERGEFLGMFGAAIRADFFIDLIAKRKVGETGHGFMVNRDGVVVAHPERKHVLKLNASALAEMNDLIGPMIEGKTGVAHYKFEDVEKIAGFAPVGVNGWSVGVAQDVAEFLAVSRSIRNVIGMVALAVVVFAVGVFFLIGRHLVKPINLAVNGLKDIAQGEGDLTKRLEAQRKDEVGELAKWFNTFMDKLQAIIKQIGGSVETLATSSTDLSAISTQMTHAARNTLGKANTVSAAAEKLSSNMDTVAAAMEQSSTNTHMVATAAEEMSATINEIAKNSEKASMISSRAAQQAGNASGQMENLGKAALGIGQVIETITDISEQVNLLALNATIEAARAGEAGKGFAVVANEIKELAKQTAAATQDIKEKVQGIQGTTQTTMKDIDEIAKVINEVNDVVTGIASAVTEQSTATTEIANNVNQNALGIEEVNQNVSQSSTFVYQISKDIAEVNATTDEISTSSNQVDMSARDLSELSEQLRAMVNQFKY